MLQTAGSWQAGLFFAFAKWVVHGMQVFDDYLQQLGEDTAAYVRTVCQTIVLTVPKAVIYCQVGSTACLLPPLANTYHVLWTTFRFGCTPCCAELAA